MQLRDFRLGPVRAGAIEARCVDLAGQQWLVRGRPILEGDDFDLEALPLGKTVAPDHHRKTSVAHTLDQPVPPELKLLLLLLLRGAARYQEHKR